MLNKVDKLLNEVQSFLLSIIMLITPKMVIKL